MTPSSRPMRVAKRILYRAIHANRSSHQVTAHCCGLEFQFSSKCRIAEDVFSNAFERTQRSVLSRIVQPGDTVVDIGANLGFYTCLLARRVGETGRVIAVEPTPSMFELLTNNVAINRLNRNVSCHQVALSDRNGVASLHTFSEGNEVYNSLTASKSWIDQPSEGTIQVGTTTLDALAKDISSDAPCFLKVDVEGFQHQVLQGGSRLLERLSKVSLMVELNDNASSQNEFSAWDTIRLVESWGFIPFVALDGAQLVPLSSLAGPGEPLNRDVFLFKETPALI